jgi:hypothetical protein
MSGAVCSRHCSSAFEKHVLPQLVSPVGGLGGSWVVKWVRNLSYGYRTWSGRGATSSRSGSFLALLLCAAAAAALRLSCSHSAL